MHNRVQQLGFFHTGLGRFVYNDEPQMGSIWTDIQDTANSITDGIYNLQAAGEQIGILPTSGTATTTPVATPKPVVRPPTSPSMLTSSTLIKGIPNAVVYSVGFGLFAFTMLMVFGKKKHKEAVVQYLPMPMQQWMMPQMAPVPVAAPPAPAAPAVAKANPRKRRRVSRRRHGTGNG